MNMFTETATFVIYDGECPFCTKYVELLRLREAVGPVNMISARDDHPAVRYAISRGVDFDQEMALIMHGKIHSGPDCIHRLALMSTGAGFFNAITARIFSSRRLTGLFYPALRAGRNLTLRLMGRGKITELTGPK
jgi:predicted DCC family thiol-disulfide oxidoreductase YuxK